MVQAPPQDAWQRIVAEAKNERDPELRAYLRATILDQPDMANALAAHLARKLHRAEAYLPSMQPIMAEIFADAEINALICADLYAILERDSACASLYVPFLYFKGFAALQNHRIAHYLWHQKRRSLALLLQSLSSEIFVIDIHPATRIGRGVMMDHGSAIVIGETAVVGDNVSIMQGVTLGGTGKEKGERHPKVGSGVLISAGATILGNINIGTGAKIAAGSVVLQEVAPHTTVAGIPAVPVGVNKGEEPALEMDHNI